MIVISEVTAVAADVVEAFGRLFPQLTALKPPDHGALDDAVRDPNTRIFIVRDTGVPSARIVGTATLVLYRTPLGLRAWMEDVVVDGSVRGKGVGTLLCQMVIEQACAAGAVTLNLTSEPSREAANRLYQRLGFEQRHTNVYRYFLQKSRPG